MKFDLRLLEFVECEKDSQKLAISGSDRDLSWEEFKNEVEKLKIEISQYNLPKGHPVLIYGHKEVKFIVTMVACMSLGLPYIENNISFDLNNLNTSYNLPDPIVYIIFTSGSTGEPKGVQITRDSILDFVTWLESDFKFSDKNIFMNQAPFSFDLSVYELVGFLLFGGTILLNSRETIENHIEYFDRLKKYNCNTWVSTPSFISKYLLSSEFTSNEINSLETFLFCGEVLPSTTAKRINIQKIYRLVMLKKIQL